MTATPEAILKTEIRRALTEIDVFWSNVTGGAYSKPGDPDIVSCVDGYYLAIEAKSKVGRQSDIQKVRQGQIERSGGMYIIARSVEDALKAVDWLEGRKGN